jgi:hypothetical protein
MVKCTNNIFGAMDIFYVYLFVCTHNVHYVFLFFMVPILLLCFRWVHFLWYGYVCMGVLMDVNQGSRRNKEDKRTIKGVLRRSGWAFFPTSFWDVCRDKWRFLAF